MTLSEHTKHHGLHGHIHQFKLVNTPPNKKVPPVHNLSWCSGCQQFLPITEFTKDCTKWDGLRTYCKICRRKTIKGMQKQKQKEYNKQYYLKHREQLRERHREWGRKWWTEHPEEAREQQRKWRAKNPEHYKAWGREYYQRNREEIRRKHKEYYQKNRYLKGDLTKKNNLVKCS